MPPRTSKRTGEDTERVTPSKKSKQGPEETPDEGESSGLSPAPETPPSNTPESVLITKLPELETLPRIQYCLYEDSSASPNLVNLEYAFQDPIAARMSTLDTLTLNSPSLVNLGMADPNKFIKLSTYLTLKGQAKPTRFFMTGVTARSSLFSGDYARSICIAPSGVTFPRAMAVAGHLFKRNNLVVPSFRQNVSFSSYKKTASSSGSPARVRGSPVRPGPKLAWGAPVRQWNEDVPTYDGREGFNLLTYRSLPMISNDELMPNTGVVVIFTVGHYKPKEPIDGNKELNFVLSLNIQEVILIADPDSSINDTEIPSCVELGIEPEKMDEEAVEELDDENAVWV